jgi:membrane protein implicated in regulation of membrane protease activity
VTKRDKKDPSVTNSLQPSRRDRFLPVELLSISAGLAVFVGLIVVISTRQFVLAGVALGIAFIVSLVLTALFALAFKPTAAEVEDIHEQDAEAQEKAAGHDGTQPGPAANGEDRPRDPGSPAH